MLLYLIVSPFPLVMQTQFIAQYSSRAKEFQDYLLIGPLSSLYSCLDQQQMLFIFPQ